MKKILLASLMTIIVIVGLFMGFCGGITILFSPDEGWPMILGGIFMVVGSIFIYNFFTQEHNQDEALLTKILKNLGKALFSTLATLLILVGGIGTLCGGLVVGSGEFSGIIFIIAGLIMFSVGSLFTKAHDRKKKTENKNIQKPQTQEK